MLSSRLVPACILIMFHGLVAAACLGLWDGVFDAYRIPVLQPHFADMRSIPALAAWNEGRDLRIENPADPWGRPFNYPAIWVYLVHLLSRAGDPVAIFGFGQIALSLAFALWAVTRIGDAAGRLVLVLLFCSAPIVLLLERGNSDGAVFLVSFAAILAGGMRGGLLVGLAATLKAFPLVFMLALLLRKPGARAAALGFLIALPAVAWTVAQLPQMLQATPVGTSTSFGIRAMAALLSRALEIFAPGWWGALPEGAFAVFVAAVFVALAVLFHRAFRRDYTILAGAIATRPALAHIATGFGIVACVVFVASSSWAYRFIFFAPAAFVVLAESTRLRAGLSWPFRVAMFVASLLPFWVPLVPQGWFLFNPACLLAIAALVPTLAGLTRHALRAGGRTAPAAPLRATGA